MKTKRLPYATLAPLVRALMAPVGMRPAESLAAGGDAEGYEQEEDIVLALDVSAPAVAPRRRGRPCAGERSLDPIAPIRIAPT